MSDGITRYRWPDSVAAWTGLRAIGNSRFAKASIAVPLFGYFLLFNDRLVEYLRLNTDFCRDAGCEASWRLYFIYFGLCFAAAGSAMFAWRCPHIVKRYSTSRDFFETSRIFYTHPHNLGWMLDDIQVMQGSPYQDAMSLPQLVASGATIGLNEAHVLSGPMSAYYNLRNQSRAISRWLALLSYFIAAALLAVPTAATFVQVAGVAYSKAMRSAPQDVQK